MEYTPKVIKGKVHGTGLPIDGHELWFSMWDYDDYSSWHLWGWSDDDDEAVMKTMFRTETDAGLCMVDALEEFERIWKETGWEGDGTFTLPLDNVEVIEVKQEEGYGKGDEGYAG